MQAPDGKTMKIHLVDGRMSFSAVLRRAREKGTRWSRNWRYACLLNSFSPSLQLRRDHIACAFDHVIESFRNDLFQATRRRRRRPGPSCTILTCRTAVSALAWLSANDRFEADDALLQRCFASRMRLLWISRYLLTRQDLLNWYQDPAWCAGRRREIVYDERR